MDKQRIALALAVAFVLSFGATFFMYKRLRDTRAAQPQTQKVIASSKALLPGTTLSAENLALIDWPITMVPPGSFTKVEDVAGRSLIYPVDERQLIRPSHLAAPGSGIGLAVKIPEGMRATSVRSNEVVGVAGFLNPGSRVDVLVTYKGEGTPTPAIQTVLQNVEVLTAGQRIEPDPQGKPETVNVVTLLLTPQDSEKIVLASQQGSVQFVLRNGADQAKVETRPVEMSELMTGVKKEAPVARPKARVTKPKDFYEVETINGNKSTTQKFETSEKQ